MLASLEGLGGRVSQFQLSESRDGRDSCSRSSSPSAWTRRRWSRAGRRARGRPRRALGRLEPGSPRRTRSSCGSCGPRCRTGSSGCSTPTATRRDRLDVPRERAREGAASGAGHGPRRGSGRGLRDRGRGARRPTGRRVRAGPRTASRRCSRARRRAEPRARVRVRARVHRPGRRAARHRHGRRARSRPSPRGSEGFGYDPIFVPPGEPRTVLSSGRLEARALPHRARGGAQLARAYAMTNDLRAATIYVIDRGGGARARVVSLADRAGARRTLDRGDRRREHQQPRGRRLSPSPAGRLLFSHHHGAAAVSLRPRPHDPCAPEYLPSGSSLEARLAAAACFL